jgi:biopolymer transport protein TolQ
MSGDTVLNLIWQAGPVVKFVLLILLFFSVFSWAIIIYKFRFLSKVERESEDFQRAFRKSKDWNTLYQTTKRFPLGPVVNLFRSVYSAESREETDREEIKRTMKRIESLEAARLEKYLTFLATTGSTTPFIGLFGTVWGIMNSFRGIGRIGSASLAVVAPGIAEALIFSQELLDHVMRKYGETKTGPIRD